VTYKKLSPAELWSAMDHTNDAIADVLRHQDFLQLDNSPPKDSIAKANLGLANLRTLRNLRKDFDRLSDELQRKIEAHIKKERQNIKKAAKKKTKRAAPR
jgi:hypothetical protein